MPQPHRPLDPLTMHSTYDRASSVPRTPLTGPNIDYPVLYGKYLNGLGRLPAKTLKPEVRLVKLPFFNMLDELLKPTELGKSPPPLGVAPPSEFFQRPRPAKQPTQSIFWGAARAEGLRGACPSQEAQGPPWGPWISNLLPCNKLPQIDLHPLHSDSMFTVLKRLSLFPHLLNLDWPCKLHWLIKHGRRNYMPVHNPGLKRTHGFTENHYH